MGASERIGEAGGAAALSVLRDEVARRQAAWREEARARRCPTGFAELDAVLEGGFGRGLVSVVAGVVGSGRTSLVARAVAAATQRGEPCAWVDPAGSLSVAGLLSSGVRLERLLHVQPPQGDTFWTAQLLARCAAFSLVVVDLDGWVGTSAGPSTATYEAALHRLAESARAAGPAVVLLADTPQPLPAALRVRLTPGFGTAPSGRGAGAGGDAPRLAAVHSLDAFRTRRSLGNEGKQAESKAPDVTDPVVSGTPVDEGLLRPVDPRTSGFRLVLEVERSRRAPSSPVVVPADVFQPLPPPSAWSPPPTVDARGRPIRPFVAPPREGFGEVVVRPRVPRVHTRAPSRYDPDRLPPPADPGAPPWSVSLPLRPRNVPPELREKQGNPADSGVATRGPSQEVA